MVSTRNVASSGKPSRLRKSAMINNASILTTKRAQDRQRRSQNKRPALLRRQPFAPVKQEPASSPGTLSTLDIEDAPNSSEIERNIEAYKLNTNVWSIMPAHLSQQGDDSFADAFQTMTSELAAGTGDIDGFCGSHPHVGALLDSSHYKRAPRLSQIIADLLLKLRPAERLPSASTIAIMWLHWCLWTWFLNPSTKTFERLPILMRPAALQISIPHERTVDFVLSPVLRESYCQARLGNEQALSSISSAELRAGPKTAFHALVRNEITHALDVDGDCRAHAAFLRNWTTECATKMEPDNDETCFKQR